MLNTYLTALTIGTALIAAPAAHALTEIRSVNVEVDLDAIENERAAEYWTDIADDLETALVSRLTDQISETSGASVSIDINELSLATVFQEDHGLEDTKLVGQVSVVDLQDQSAREFYELSVTYDQAVSFLPDADGNTVAVSMTDREYYDTMIDAFADNVVAKLK